MSLPHVINLCTLFADGAPLQRGRDDRLGRLALLVAALVAAFACVRFIPNNRVGLWESAGAPSLWTAAIRSP